MSRGGRVVSLWMGVGSRHVSGGDSRQGEVLRVPGGLIYVRGVFRALRG